MERRRAELTMRKHQPITEILQHFQSQQAGEDLDVGVALMVHPAPEESASHLSLMPMPSRHAELHGSRPTLDDPADVPRQAVWNTAELLEHILVHLSPVDLVRSQRVARAWQDSMLQSVSIQKKLFLLQRETNEHWSHSRGWQTPASKWLKVSMTADEYETEKTRGHPNETVAILRGVNHFLVCQKEEIGRFLFDSRHPTHWAGRTRSILGSHTLSLSKAARSTMTLMLNGERCGLIERVHFTDRCDGAGHLSCILTVEIGAESVVEISVKVEARSTIGDVVKAALETTAKGVRRNLSVRHGVGGGRALWGTAYDYVDWTVHEVVEHVTARAGRKACVTSGHSFTIEGVYLPSAEEMRAVDARTADSQDDC